MTINVAPLPEPVAAPQVSRAQQALLSVAGASDAGAIARQQLPSAVPAAALIPAYLSQAQTPPKQTTPKLFTATPSSGFATQVLAQDEQVDAETMALFQPRRPATNTAAQFEGDDYLHDMRLARGDFSAIASRDARALPATVQHAQLQKAAEQAAVQKQQLSLALGTEPSARASLGQLVAGLPQLLNQFLRKPNLVQARGVSAYQVALERLASLKKPAEPAA